MRVLVIEDDRVLGEAVREHVASFGYGVDWMKRIDEARDALATVPYDLVLLDLNLPDGRGMDLLRELRRGGSKVPVIILTAMDQIASRIEGLNSGAEMPQHAVGGERQQSLRRFMQGMVEGLIELVIGNIAGIGRGPAPQEGGPERKADDQSRRDGRKYLKAMPHGHAPTL
jgi:CheY-like chemotaxis protein